jgi:PAS domain S-box-containing protein
MADPPRDPRPSDRVVQRLDAVTDRGSNGDGDQTRGARVVLCVDDPGTRHSLQSWFESHDYAVETADARTLPEDGDLYVVDQGSLRRTASPIEDIKDAQSTFLPCLLVAASEHADRIDRSEDAVLDVVDDVLHIPLQTPALRRRVESLLRARRLSEALSERTARYEGLVDVLPAALFVLDGDGTVTYANPAAADLVGEDDATDLTGEQLLAFVHPEDRTTVDACVGPDPLEPEDPPIGPLSVRLTTCRSSPPSDRPLAADATDRPTQVEATITALPESAGHQVLVHDVTDREHRLERLRVFERAIEESTIGISIADAQADDDPLVYVNDGFVELTGYDRETALGRNCRFLQGDDTDPETVTAIRKALAAGEPVSVTIKNYRADGTAFWNSLDITPVRDEDGELTHFLGFQRDVTDRRERMRLFEHLHDATAHLQRARTPEAVAETAVDAMRDILEFEIAECWFPNEPGTRLDTVALAGTEHGYPLDQTDPEWDAFLEGRPVMEVPIVAHDLPAESGIVFSLGDHGLIGAADAERRYTDAVKDAGRVLAAQVTVALDRASREAELAEAKDELEHTLERINDGFMSLDETFEVTYVNGTAEELLPYDADELIGHDLWELFPELVGSRFWEEYHDALETQRPRTFQAYEDAIDAWFEVSVYPSQDGLTIYFKDVTESREHERALERYERIVQTAGDPIYTLDADGRFQDVNRAFLEMTGYDRETVLGADVDLVLESEDIARGERAIRDLLTRDDLENQTVDLTVRTKHGERRDAEVSIAPLPGEDFAGTVGVIRDVTELKDTEQRIAVLDRVLRHNLRNNLNVVAGRAGALTDHEDDAVAEEAAIVEDAAEDVLKMAEKARTFQHALGDTADRARVVDVADVVATAVETVRSSTDARDVAVSVDCPESLRIRANEAVTHAVEELLENAIVHNSSPTPSVAVDVSRDGEDAVIAIADDGPPIPDLEIEVLEGGRTETPLDHASGLGLWLVNWTASTFGGDLSFDRTGDGNVVTLRFPLVTE